MVYWLLVVVLFTIIEMVTLNLITIWFVISALAALLISIFNDNFLLQLFVFVVTGIILLVSFRPMVKNYFEKNKNKTRTNIDRIVGMNGAVTEKIESSVYGEVKVDGKLWTAYSDEEIKKGTLITVLEINGVKLKVEAKK